MKFNNCEELIQQFNSLPKDKTISSISNGSITKYIADAYLYSMEIQYKEENIINLVILGLRQDGFIKKIKIFPHSKLEIKFNEDDLAKGIAKQDDFDSIK
jgi:hypothetical protein